MNKNRIVTWKQTSFKQISLSSLHFSKVLLKIVDDHFFISKSQGSLWNYFIGLDKASKRENCHFFKKSKTIPSSNAIWVKCFKIYIFFENDEVRHLDGCWIRQTWTWYFRNKSGYFWNVGYLSSLPKRQIPR